MSQHQNLLQREADGRPLGLAHNVKRVRPVAQSQSLSWDDVAIDTTTRASALRREMQTSFEA